MNEIDRIRNEIEPDRGDRISFEGKHKGSV